MSRHGTVPDEKAPRELLFCYLDMQLKYRDGWVADKILTDVELILLFFRREKPENHDHGSELPVISRGAPPRARCASEPRRER
jgi:hypothetical protein